MPPKRIRIGDLLVQNAIISQAQLEQALASQKETGRKLGKTLVELGFVAETDLLEFLSRQLQIPLLNLRQYKIDPQAVKLLPETHARRFRAIVLSRNGGEAIVGMADPTDIVALDEIGRILKVSVHVALVRESDLLHMIDQMYRRTDEITNLAGQIGEELAQNDFDLATLAGGAGVADAPVVKLLQSLFEDAVQVRASDIHIEPDEGILRIRQRVDGMLQEHVIQERRAASALVSRLKLMSSLNISERRVPQDGRFSIRVRERNIDVRLSTMPVQHGESVVMRLLDRSGGILNLDEVGMPAELLARFRRNIRLPHGMVLVTGPTGSGKTTTLYAALSELNSPEKKIITAEDPVEYTLHRVNQVQIHPQIGLTFASVLRSALRQDPDIVLVGEIRDRETAEIALRAALTGHLVLSTLHTNGAVATASRLLDMGAEGFLVAAALRAVVAQRLVRRICDSCSLQDDTDPRERAALEAELGVKTDGITFRRGAGCQHCNNTGYRGRVGVYELLETTPPMLDALRRNDSAAFTAAASAAEGFRPFSLCAFDYAVQGITSVAEVIRIAGEIDSDSPAGAARALQGRALVPVSIVEAENEVRGGGRGGLRRIRMGRRKPGIDDLMFFCRQMRTLVSSGVPLIRGLSGLAETTRSEVLAETLREVIRDLQGGYGLSQAFNQHPAVFPPMIIGILQVGERSGRVDEAFLHLAGYLERERDTRTRIRAAMRYPVMVLVAIAAALAVINLFVIPAFARVFAGFHAELPWATKVLLTTSDFTVRYWPAVLIAIGVALWLWLRLIRTPKGRLWWDRLKLRLPVIGPIISKSMLARFARSFAMVTKSGVPIVQGLSLIAGVVDNAHVAGLIGDMRRSIERGESVGRTAAGLRLFPPLVLQMIEVGEESGRLEEMMEEVADFYDGEVDLDLKSLSTAIEPILLLVVGAMVLILALAVFLPMWDLGRTA
ncbi:MAG: biosis protein MshE, partial [Proteobacteria bacterium]|nr:biosis protein MshE [Pseudomonadota bacterium]